MTGTGPRRQVLQLTAAEGGDTGGRTQLQPVNAFDALLRAQQGLDGVRDGRGTPFWAVTRGPGAHPTVPGQFLLLADARYAAGGRAGTLRLGCVSAYVSVNYPDYQGIETLLTFNFEDSLDWYLPQGGELANLTVVRVWEELEAWLGTGRVMWEGQ